MKLISKCSVVSIVRSFVSSLPSDFHDVRSMMRSKEMKNAQNFLSEKKESLSFKQSAKNVIFQVSLSSKL